MEYRFAWAGSGPFAVVRYRVEGDGAPYLIELRTSADSDYERSITRPETWTEIETLVGSAYRDSYPRDPIPTAVLTAFNSWRTAEHSAILSMVRADPDRYGQLDETDPLFRAPTPARGAHYTPSGWAFSEPPEPEPPPST